MLLLQQRFAIIIRAKIYYPYRYLSSYLSKADCQQQERCLFAYKNNRCSCIVIRIFPYVNQIILIFPYFCCLYKKGGMFLFNPTEISVKIKSVAQLKNVSVKQLLENCKINKGFIYDLEHKSSYPSCDKLARIADYLDVSVDYLIGRTDNPQSHTF